MNSLSTHGRAALWLLVIAFVLLVADTAYADVMTDIGKGYQAESAKWFPKLLVIAKSLFWKLAAIEFAWASILWVLKNQEMQSFTAAVVQKLIGIGFFYALLQNADYWIPAIVNSLAKSGNEATGLPALTPSEVFDLGIDTAVTMLDGIQKLSLWDDFATIVIAGLAALCIVISFLVIAGQMLIALIESYIAISGGVLFLGFGGSRWTVEFTQKYISYAFATGIKLFMLYLIIGVGTAQAKTWAALLATTDWNNIFTVMGGSMLLAFMGFQIPNMAAAMLSGAPALTAGAAAATAATVAAGTVAAGATAISPAMQSARGGMQALKAGYDHHRAGGGGVLSSALKAVGTSSVDMGREAGRSAGEAVGIAKPTTSERSTVGGRAAERRDGMTAQLREERAAVADAGGMSKGSGESNAGGAGSSVEGDSAKNDSTGNKSATTAPVVPPPATPSGAAGGATGGLGGASMPLGGNPQVVDDFGNVVVPSSGKIAESNAGGAGTSATNAAAANTSAGTNSATGSGLAQAGSSGSIRAQTLAAATPEAQRQSGNDLGSTVAPPSTKIAESNAGGAGTSAANTSAANTSAGNTSTGNTAAMAAATPAPHRQVVDDYGNVVSPPSSNGAESNPGGAGTSEASTSAMNTSPGNTSATSMSAPSGAGSSAPAPGAGQSGPASGRDKTPFQDLQHIRPPQIPNDSAPQAGVNIRLSHSEE